MRDADAGSARGVQGARGGDFVSPNTIGWLQAYSDELRASKNPTGTLRIAAE